MTILVIVQELLKEKISQQIWNFSKKTVTGGDYTPTTNIVLHDNIPA